MKKDESLTKRFFYHSFPRRFAGNSNLNIKKGLSILESIKNIGFILTPEITEWQEPLDNGSSSKPWRLIQKRCCFTELSYKELKDHADFFGGFALEFEIPVLRQLGGIPVFYMPKPTKDDKGLESLASSLIARMGEIQKLLDRLSDLESLVEKAKDDNTLIEILKNDQNLGAIQCSIGGAKNLISFFRYESQPIYILRNALRALGGFFYPTENIQFNEDLAYYQQREWRIIANMSKLGQELTREPTNEEKEILLNIDKEFFGKEINFHTGKYRRVDQCQIFEKLDETPVLKYASRVIVPKEALIPAKKILNEEDDPPVSELKLE